MHFGAVDLRQHACSQSPVPRQARRRLRLHALEREHGAPDVQKLYTSQLYTPPQRFLAAVDLELLPGA